MALGVVVPMVFLGELAATMGIHWLLARLKVAAKRLVFFFCLLYARRVPPTVPSCSLLKLCFLVVAGRDQGRARDVQSGHVPSRLHRALPLQLHPGKPCPFSARRLPLGWLVSGCGVRLKPLLRPWCFASASIAAPRRPDFGALFAQVTSTSLRYLDCVPVGRYRVVLTAPAIHCTDDKYYRW